MLPYSDNVIFFDTEFTTLDPQKGELMSIGLVSYDGRNELYLELEYDSKTVEPWVKKHVLPTLRGDAVSKSEAQKMVERFLGGPHAKEKDKPYLVSYVNQFDAIYWYKFFGSPKDHPAYWIPIDFASILFAHGYSPNSLGKHRFFEQLNIDKSRYKEHNALDDARLLREVYVAFLALTNT